MGAKRDGAPTLYLAVSPGPELIDMWLRPGAPGDLTSVIVKPGINHAGLTDIPSWSPGPLRRVKETRDGLKNYPQINSGKWTTNIAEKLLI